MDEARQRGTDPWNPAAFAMLGAVGAAVGDLSPEDAPSDGDHGLAVFYAYHLWATGADLALVSSDSLRQVVRSREGPAPSGVYDALAPTAGYLQLPQHLVWLEAEDPAVPESVDGILWVVSPRGVVHLAVVAGIRSDRAGFVLVPVPPQPLTELAGWLTGPAREEGEEFGTNLPGRELDGLLGLKTPAEALKLAAGLLSLRAEVEEGSTLNRPSEAEESGPPPSRLPYHAL